MPGRQFVDRIAGRKGKKKAVSAGEEEEGDNDEDDEVIDLSSALAFIVAHELRTF